MEERCRKEVEDLHQFFQDWFQGTVNTSDRVFDRVSCALADEFFLVSARGVTETKTSILENIRAAHGRRQVLRIWTDDFFCRLATDDLCLVTYREWQKVEERTTTRHSSALFRRSEEAPNGVEWVHLHETWVAP